MNLGLLFSLAERLRIEAIGDPSWIKEKGVFEYQDNGVEIVAVLKAVGAAQGIKSLDVLCRSGLFIDMGAIYRCINDCTSEVYFLLESYPDQSSDVRRFVKAFFEATIDGHLSAETEPVQTKKIRSAVVRVLTGMEQDESTRTLMLNVYKTFCGYTHANYSHIMEIYGGTYPDLSFNVAGVPSVQQQEMHMKIVEQAYLSVLYSLAFIARTLKLNDLHKEISQCC
jgi:hypothetical protein